LESIGAGGLVEGSTGPSQIAQSGYGQPNAAERHFNRALVRLSVPCFSAAAIELDAASGERTIAGGILANTIDPENSVVRFCAEGMEREQEGRHDEALRLFTRAWDQSEDAFERTIAAHYLARHQTTTEAKLHWNQESLSNADAVGDDRVQALYPSLYLNMGKSHEDLGNLTDAKRFYDMAADRIDELPEGHYGDVVRQGVINGLQRISNQSEKDA
jgi:tetratricopeptide (TPR) repeat protein